MGKIPSLSGFAALGVISGFLSGCVSDNSPTPLHSELRIDRDAVERDEKARDAKARELESTRRYDTNILAGVGGSGLGTGPAPTTSTTTLGSIGSSVGTAGPTTAGTGRYH